MALRHFAWKNDGEVPPQAQLAPLLTVSKPSLIGYYRNLEEHGYISRERTAPNEPHVIVLEEIRGQESLPRPGQESLPPVDKNLDRPRARVEGSKTLRANTDPSSEGSPARPTDELFDAIRRATSPNVESARQLTRPEQQKIGVAAAELRKVAATPAQVEAIAAVYRAHSTYRDCALTPQALVAHWGELTPKAKPPPPCPSCSMGGGRHTADCAA